MKDTSKPIIYIISDSIGETAELVVKAAASQFTPDFVIRRIPYVDDKETILSTITKAKRENAIIGFTLVIPEIKQFLIEEAEKEKVEVVDIIGPMIGKMEQLFKKVPRNEPGLVHQLDEDYFRKVEAIEFAVKYDDGRDPRGILKADIVLVGVSRTSKTPLSQYLALKRLKVANVPLVPEIEPPKELFKVSRNKCYGLRISPEKLNDIRRERLKVLGLNDQAQYANLERIKEELDYFNLIINRLNCKVIDVSNKAVEETANYILNNFRGKM